MSTLTREWPHQLSHSALFILAATFILVLFGWSVDSQLLSVIQTQRPPSTPFGRLLFLGATVVGIILPILALIFFRRDRVVRQIFTNFIAVLAAQIISEGLLSRTFFPSLVIPVALLYIGYRLWQIMCALSWLSHADFSPERVIVRGVLRINLFFWFGVWAHLFTSRLPAIV
jgi:hypothetical protein